MSREQEAGRRAAAPDDAWDTPIRAVPLNWPRAKTRAYYAMVACGIAPSAAMRQIAP